MGVRFGVCADEPSFVREESGRVWHRALRPFACRERTARVKPCFSLPPDLSYARRHVSLRTDQYQTGRQRPLQKIACVLLGSGLLLAIPPAACADQGAEADASAEFGRVVMMQRYIVSATRIDKNPWRYASFPGFEILSRADDDATAWWIDANRRGWWFENEVLPKDWLPPSPVPYTLIIDDTNLETVPIGELHSQPITFRSPADALTWGELSGRTRVWHGHFGAHDDDTFAANTNVYKVDTRIPAYGSISLERLFRCTPPLPQWLMAGLFGQDCGIFRESFMPVFDQDSGFSRIDINRGGLARQAVGPGTLWVSLDETQRLLQQLRKDKKTRIAIPPLRELFAEAPPAAGSLPLWDSEAGLFVRWGLMGPGHKDPVMSRAFLELVRRARRAPVTEQVFVDCFGFGYAAMEEKLEAFLKTVLAQPNIVYVTFPSDFPEVYLKDATADQIGRILGDWLRMQGGSLRNKDPEMSGKFLKAAGRMLQRAYRDDNGLPPDVDPAPQGGRTAQPLPKDALGPAVVMKPFVVAAARIHDPGLLSVYGLYEHDTGNDDKAREFLEAAVTAGVVRPKAHLVLAELRYAEAIGKPSGSEGKLSAQQAASILAPLQTALQYAPVSGGYHLLALTWAHCEAKPADRDVEKMVEGVALFPRNTRLAFLSALVCARSGYAAQAVVLIDTGLVSATNENDRDNFRRLRSTLVAPVVSK